MHDAPHQPETASEPGNDWPEWTVTIQTPARLDGEKPYDYVLYAPTADAARRAGLAAHVITEWDRSDGDHRQVLADGNPAVFVEQVQPGVPTSGTWFNDLRATVNDRDMIAELIERGTY